MIYEEIFKKLNDSKIDYLVVGGVALVLHGAIRLTVDLDLMLLPESNNFHKFISTIESLGFRAKLPGLPNDINLDLLKEWKKTRNLEVFSFYNENDPLKIIDILIDPVVDYKEALRDKKIINLGETKVCIISINNLKKLKEDTGRSKDAEDIVSLSKLQNLGEQDGE